MKKEFIRVDAACRLLSLSRSTLYKKTMNREVRFFKIKKVIWFRESDLIAYLEQHVKEPMAVIEDAVPVVPQRRRVKSSMLLNEKNVNKD